MQSEPPLVVAGNAAPGDVDLARTFRALVAGWRVIVASVVTTLVIAVIYLNIVPYRYEIEMRVAPVAGGGGDGLSSKLSSLGGLAAVAGVSLPDSGGAGSFKLFVEAVHSHDVALVLARDPEIMHRVFHRQWDAGSRTWRVPHGGLHLIASSLKPLLGTPERPFAPPGAAELQKWMTDEIGVDQNIKSPVVTLTLLSEDPVFAVYFFDRLTATIDAMLRRRALLRADDYIRYLSARLTTVTLAEQRVAIAQALGEQERLKMVASSDRPFSAEVFENPAATDRPVTPQPLKVLALAGVVGLGVGITAALRRRSGTAA